MKYKAKLALSAFILVLSLAILSACNLVDKTAQTPAQNPGLIYTAAAQTVAAQLTQAAVGTPVVFPTSALPTVQPSPTQNVVVQPSQTTIPTNTAVPPTPIPATSTTIPTPCDRASFVKENYEDGSELAAGTNFVKKWTLKNTGTCTWNSSYSLVFVSGDSMGSPASQQLTTGVVSPGDSIEVAVGLVSPTAAKTYQGFFQLRNSAGSLFGIGTDAKANFWVKIKVVVPSTATPTPTQTTTPTVQPTLTATPSAALQFDLVTRGPSASWSTTTNTSLPWGDPTEDKNGMAYAVNNHKMEDRYTYPYQLITLPVASDGGYIRGRYEPYTIQTGDHFRTAIGMAAGCTNVKVRYQIKYEESGAETLLGEWLESCDGSLTFIDKDLGGLVGKTVNFILIVTRESGNMSLDLTYWVFPRVEH